MAKVNLKELQEFAEANKKEGALLAHFLIKAHLDIETSDKTKMTEKEAVFEEGYALGLKKALSIIHQHFIK